MTKHVKVWAVVFMSLLLIVGCSEEEQEDASNEDQDTEEVDGAESEGSSNDDMEELPDEQVVFSGELEYKDNELWVEGETNLPEGATVDIVPKPLDKSVFINVSGHAKVEEDGSFKKELKVPEKYEYGLFVDIRFRISNQADDTLEEVYGENGDSLEGSFVRLYELSGELYKEASARVYLPLDGNGEVTVKIEEPNAEPPSDVGSQEIRIEAEAFGEADFVEIKGESNLVEGSNLGFDLRDEEERNVASSNNQPVDPDGSFHRLIEIPDDVSDLDDYSVRIVFDPQDFDWEPVVEAYGTGENLSGDLVEEDRAILDIPVK